MKKVFIAFAILTAAMLAACQETDIQKDTEETIVPVETVQALQDDLITDKTFYAAIQPAATTPVMIQAPGSITKLDVENGDMVEKNDYLATVAGRSIYAPASGKVANLTAEKDSTISNSDPLMIIANVEELKLTFELTAEQLKLVEKGKEYHSLIQDENVTAKITSIGTLPNESGLFQVQAKTDNEDMQLLPGGVAVMTIPETKTENAILVPTESIRKEGGKAFLYIVKHNQVKKTAVTILETQSDKTAVKGSVKKGDNIVTSGQLMLSDGDRVEVEKEGVQP